MRDYPQVVHTHLQKRVFLFFQPMILCVLISQVVLLIVDRKNTQSVFDYGVLTDLWHFIVFSVITLNSACITGGLLLWSFVFSLSHPNATFPRVNQTFGLLTSALFTIGGAVAVFVFTTSGKLYDAATPLYVDIIIYAHVFIFVVVCLFVYFLTRNCNHSTEYTDAHDSYPDAPDTKPPNTPNTPNYTTIV